MAVFDLVLSRHDHHNLELKFTVDFASKPLEAKTELYLFVPATVRLASYSKQELVDDFTSKVRLALSETQQGADTLERVFLEFERTLKEYNGTDAEPLKDSTLRLGAVLGETIKQFLGEHRKKLDEQSVFSEEEMVFDIQGIRKSVERVLSLTQPCLSSKVPYIPLLHDYVHSHYTHYLGKLYDWSNLRRELLVSVEKVDASHHLALWDDPVKLEQHYLRLSQLKKFFQSTMFVDVSRTQLVRKIAEPAAATAAGLAALWAAIFQQFQQPGMIRFGLSGITFLCELMAKGKSLGLIREWFHLTTVGELAKETSERRAHYHLSDAERHIPEDVFKYTRTVLLPEQQDSRYQALQESLRINMERYLKYMDDPYKTITLFNDRGEPEQVKSPRVYYFYLLGQIQLGKDIRSLEYRIVMDKRGVQRVEALSREEHLALDPLPAFCLGAATT